jgi:hypothetical protein
MLKRLVGASVVAALAGCGDGRDADADTGGAAEEREEVPSSRFEVSVDTQRVGTPDSAVAPSENPDN